MIVHDFYYKLFSTRRYHVNILKEFLCTFLYSICDSYDVLEVKLDQLLYYLDDLCKSSDGSWVCLDYKQFGFTDKDFNIVINPLLRKAKINGIEIRPGYFKDVVDYFYFIKIIFCIDKVAEIKSDNYDDIYSVRVLDRVYVPGYEHEYHCVPIAGGVRIATTMRFNIYDLGEFLEHYDKRDLEPSEEFYIYIFEYLSNHMKSMHWSTYLNGLCMAYLYDDCSKKFPNVKLDKYLDRIQFASEVYSEFTSNYLENPTID